MSSVDNRIVKMIFDNEKFESGVQKTLDTLDKLKEKLTFKNSDKTFKGIETSINGMNFNGVESGVEALQKRFSTLGIVGMEVTRRITNAAIDAGKRISNATLGQIKQGGMTRALNIEQARFQLKGLGLDVEEVMSNANAAVDGTAYGLDEAAKAASVLGASGVKAGAEMESALTSISGAAAMTGRSYSDIANIYSTVAGNGRLMTQQLNQFSASGLNVAATLAKEMGTSEQAIREMVHDGEISFKQFSKYMNEAFGKHAKAANETYQGSLSNLRAALSRIGQIFASPYLENAKFVFHALTAGINEVKKALEPFASIVGSAMSVVKDFIVNGLGKLTGKALKNGKYQFGAIGNLVDGLVNIFGALWSAIKPIGKAFTSVFPKATFDNLAKVIGRFKEFTATLELNKKQATNMEFFYKAIFSIFKLIGTVVRTVIKGIGKIFKPFGGLLNVVNFLVGAVSRLVYWFITAVTKVRLVSRAFSFITTVIGGVFTGIVWLVKAISNVVKAVANSKPVVAVANAISSAFKFCSKYVSLFIDKLKELGKKASTFIGSSAASAISKFSSILSSGITAGAKFIGKLIDKFKELFKTIKNSKAFTTFANSVSNIGEYFGKFIDKVKEVVRAIADWVQQHHVVQTFINALATGLKIVFGVLTTVALKIKEFATSFYDFLKDSGLLEKFIDLIKTGFTEAVDKIKTFAKWVAEKIQGPLQNASDKASNFKDRLKSAFETKSVSTGIGVFSKAVEKTSGFAGKLVKVFDFIKEAVKLGITSISGYFNKFKNISGGAFEFIKNLLGKINLEKIAKYFPYEAMGVLFLSFSKFISGFSVSVYRISDAFASLGKTVETVGGGINNVLNSFSDRLKPSPWKGAALVILALAGSVFLLAKAIKDLSEMDVPSLAKGLGVVAVTMALLVGSMILVSKAANKFKDVNFLQIGLGMIAVAASVLVLQKAMLRFADMDKNTIAKGLGLVALSIVVLSMAVNAMDTKSFLKTSMGLVVLSAALMLFASTMSVYSKLDADTVKTGCGRIVAALVGFIYIARGLDNTNILKTAAGLLVLNIALVAFAGVMKIYSMMDKNTLIKGLGVLMIVFVEFIIVAHGLDKVDLKGVTKGLMGMVLATMAIAGVIWLLGKQDWKGTVAAAGSLAAVLITMALVLRGLSKNTDGFLASSAALIAVSAALGIVAMAIKMLAGMSLDQILGSAVSFAGLLLVMTMSLKVLSENTDGLLQAAGALIAISAALGIVAVAITLMSSLPTENVITSAIALAGMMAVLAIALYALQDVPAKDLLAVSGAMVIMSVAVGVLSLSLMGLSQIPMESIKTALLGLAGALLIIVGAGLLAGLGPVTVGLLVLSAALLSLGATALMISNAIMNVTMAMAMLAAMGPESMQRIVDALVEFAQALAERAPELAIAAVEIGSAFIAGLLTLIPLLAAAGVKMVVSLLAGIAQNIGQIAAYGARIIVEFIQGIAKMIGPIIQAGILLMVSFILGLANGIRDNADLVFSALGSLLEAILEMVLTALQKLLGGLPVVGKKIKGALGDMKKDMRDAFDVDDTNAKFKESLSKNQQAVEELAPNMASAGGSVKDALKGSFDGLSQDMSFIGEDGMNAMLTSIANGKGDAESTGLQISDGLVKSLQSGETKPEDVMNQLMGGYNTSLAAGGQEAVGKAGKIDSDTANQFGKNADKAKKGGKKQSSSYAAGISPGDVLKNVKAILSAAANAFQDKTAVAAVRDSGSKTVSEFAKGINKGKSSAQTAGKSAANNAKSGMESVKFDSAGLAACSGFLAGLKNTSYARQITARGTALGNMAYDAAKKAIKAKSPSKKFKQLGIWANQGFIIGLEQLQNKVYDSGYAIGDNAAKALTESVSQIYDLIDADLDTSPTITPVLDLSNVQNGIDSMNSMLDTRTMSASISGNMRGIGLQPAFAAATGDNVTNNNTNTFNITVDGAESPEAFADRLVEAIHMRQRMS